MLRCGFSFNLPAQLFLVEFCKCAGVQINEKENFVFVSLCNVTANDVEWITPLPPKRVLPRGRSMMLAAVLRFKVETPQRTSLSWSMLFKRFVRDCTSQWRSRLVLNNRREVQLWRNVSWTWDNLFQSVRKCNHGARVSTSPSQGHNCWSQRKDFQKKSFLFPLQIYRTAFDGRVFWLPNDPLKHLDGKWAESRLNDKRWRFVVAFSPFWDGTFFPDRRPSPWAIGGIACDEKCTATRQNK